MAPRANWKGALKLAELNCAIALYTAASEAERIAFNMLNRKTGHRLHRQFVDQETGDPVEHDDQVKGYDLGNGEYLILEQDEIAAAVPEADKTLNVLCFVSCGQIDDVFFDRPYYLAPADPSSTEVFALIRDGMRAQSVAALAQTVLFRRVRTVLIRAHDQGLIATTLNFDDEVRSAAEAFEAIQPRKIEKEMLDLARHIIDTKRGAFDPGTFDDRYDSALAELVKAKLAGRNISPPKPPKTTKVVDLMAALRLSAGDSGAPPEPKKGKSRKAKAPAEAPAKRRKAG